MIGLAQRHVPLRLHRRLAQAAPQGRSVRIEVVDIRGRAVSGAEVSAWTGTTLVASGTTDSSGEAILSIAPGSYDIRTVFGSRGYTYWSKASVEDSSRGGDVFVEVPLCLAQPLLTTAEGVTLLMAAALTAAGFYWRVEPAKVTGEVLFGAAIFSSIYRMSCL